MSKVYWPLCCLALFAAACEDSPRTATCPASRACGQDCCDEATETCVAGACRLKTEICTPACSGSTPECVSGACQCTATSCGTGFDCVAGACVPKTPQCDPACTDTTPECADGVCVCTLTSCGDEAECLEGSCVPKPPCVPACGGKTPSCVDHVCVCTGSSCGTGFDCVEGACVVTEPMCTPACSGTTPECVNNVCTCNATSCGEGFECVAGTCQEAVCMPACEGTTPNCVSGRCECDATSCGPDATCTAGVCVPNLPNGCGPAAAPTVLTLDAPPLPGSTETASSLYGNPLNNTCYLMGNHGRGPEAIYSYKPTDSGAFKITVLPSSSFNTVLWVGPACGDGAACEYAKDDGLSGGMETLTIDGVAGTTYYIHVDGYSAASRGTFTIEVTTPPVPGCGTYGDGAIELTLDAAPMSGSTLNAANMYGDLLGDDCYDEAYEENAPGPEVVYFYTPADSGIFTITVTPDSAYDPLLWVGPACGVGTACAYATDYSGIGGSETITLMGIANTPYYIHVDGSSATTSASRGSFTIAVTSPPVPGCESPIALTLDGGSFAGSTVDAASAYGDPISSTCYSMDGSSHGRGPEAVYAYTATRSGDFKITVTPDSSYNPLLWVAPDCGVGAACTHAADAGGSGAIEELTLNGVLGTTYYIHVDSYSAILSARQGSFTIKVSTPPPGGCGTYGDAAIVLTLDTLLSGSTAGAPSAYGNPLNSTCYSAASSHHGSGPEAVYAYTPAVSGPFTVAVIPESTFNPLVWVGPACGDGAACAQAVDGGYTGSAETLTIDGVAGTTYYVHVDSRSATDSSNQGAFTIEVTSPPLPGCGTDGDAAIELILGASPLSGTTVNVASAYGNPLGGACYSAAGNHHGLGPEKVYYYAPSNSGPFTVTVTPASGYNTLLWVGTACGDGAACAYAADSGISGAAEAITINGVAGTTYFVHVDSQYATDSFRQGTFTIAVTSPPVGACGTDGDAAIALTLGAAPLSGTTVGAQSVYGFPLSSACYSMTGSYHGKGPEAAYAYTPADSGLFMVTVTPSSSYNTLLWVGTACGDGAACAYAADGGTTGVVETIIVNGVADTTYYIHVDSQYATESSRQGTFTIAVTTPPAGSCGTNGNAAIALTPNAAPVAGTTLGAPAVYGNPLSGACYSKTRAHAKGPEAAYVYTPTDSGTFIITVTPSGSYDPLLWVGTACGDGAACQYAVDSGTSGNSESVAVDGVEGTTYYIHVDSYSATSSLGKGAFTIRLTPADTCSRLNDTVCGAGRGCYLSDEFGMAVCQTAGTVPVGGSCTLHNDCVPGSDCFLRGSSRKCYAYCDPAGGSPGCTAPAACEDRGDGTGICI